MAVRVSWLIGKATKTLLYTVCVTLQAKYSVSILINCLLAGWQSISIYCARSCTSFSMDPTNQRCSGLSPRPESKKLTKLVIWQLLALFAKAFEIPIANLSNDFISDLGLLSRLLFLIFFSHRRISLGGGDHVLLSIQTGKDVKYTNIE